MKKLAVVLVGILALSMFSGCVKEEEKEHRGITVKRYDVNTFKEGDELEIGEATCISGYCIRRETDNIFYLYGDIIKGLSEGILKLEEKYEIKYTFAHYAEHNKGLFPSGILIYVEEKPLKDTNATTITLSTEEVGDWNYRILPLEWINPCFMKYEGYPYHHLLMTEEEYNTYLNWEGRVPDKEWISSWYFGRYMITIMDEEYQQYVDWLNSTDNNDN